MKMKEPEPDMIVFIKAIALLMVSIPIIVGLGAIIYELPAMAFKCIVSIIFILIGIVALGYFAYCFDKIRGDI